MPDEEAQPFLTFLQRLSRSPFLGNIVEDEHHTGNSTFFIPDRGCAVLDRNFPPITGDQRGMVGQADNIAIAQDTFDDILGRLAGLFVYDPKNIPDWLE